MYRPVSLFPFPFLSHRDAYYGVQVALNVFAHRAQLCLPTIRLVIPFALQPGLSPQFWIIHHGRKLRVHVSLDHLSGRQRARNSTLDLVSLLCAIALICALTCKI